MADSGITTVFPEVPPLSAPSTLLSEPTLPTYSEAQRAAVKAHLERTRTSSGTWVTVRCPDDPNISDAAPRPTAPNQLGDPASLPPRLPEFYQALTEFDQTQSDLQGHARAIGHLTTKLLDIEHKISTIHEFWMDNGMHRLAHNVLPILDCGESSNSSKIANTTIFSS